MFGDLIRSWGEHAKSIAAIAGVLGLVISGLWYLFNLEQRLRTVEAQVQAVATSPGAPGTASPVAAACAELAKRAAAVYKSTKSNEAYAKPIEQLMEKMGCATRR